MASWGPIRRGWYARKENNGRIRFLSLEEETRLQNFIQEVFSRHLPEIMIALRTGMRLGAVQLELGSGGSHTARD